MDVPEEDMTAALVALTSDIAAAHVSNNRVPVEQVPALIENIYRALAGLKEPGQAEEAPPEPAVSIRSSVRPDYVVCLECGQKMTMLKRHIAVEHGMTPAEYRERWNLRIDHPLVSPNHAEKRRQLAKKIGLGRKPGLKRGGRKKK